MYREITPKGKRNFFYSCSKGYKLRITIKFLKQLVDGMEEVFFNFLATVYLTVAMILPPNLVNLLKQQRT